MLTGAADDAATGATPAATWSLFRLFCLFCLFCLSDRRGSPGVDCLPVEPEGAVPGTCGLSGRNQPVRKPSRTPPPSALAISSRLLCIPTFSRIALRWSPTV